MNYHLPEKFISRLADIVGVSLLPAIQKTFVERPTTFRVNTIKAQKSEIFEELRSAGFKIKTVQWYKDAFILTNKSKRELTELKLYADGKIYIQSLASMVPPLVLDPLPGQRVLDLTAAPGSKTSQIAALMNKTGELVANDNNKVRFFKLKHNMDQLGVAEASPNWEFSLRMEHGSSLCREYPLYFDKILLDAPCSAEARFVAGDSRTYGYWSERKIKEMAYKQRGLLLSAWGALKHGGTLVYSTCTFAPEENESQVARLLARFPAELNAIELPGLKRLPVTTFWKGKSLPVELKHAFRIMPTQEIEGFFIAKLHKLLS